MCLLRSKCNEELVQPENTTFMSLQCFTQSCAIWSGGRPPDFPFWLDSWRVDPNGKLKTTSSDFAMVLKVRALDRKFTSISEEKILSVTPWTKKGRRLLPLPSPHVALQSFRFLLPANLFAEKTRTTNTSPVPPEKDPQSTDSLPSPVPWRKPKSLLENGYCLALEMKTFRYLQTSRELSLWKLYSLFSLMRAQNATLEVSFAMDQKKGAVNHFFKKLIYLAWSFGTLRKRDHFKSMSDTWDFR